MYNKIITNIKPLGFTWETTDPFLFCVHHLDHYPRGNDQLGPAASLAGRNLGQDFSTRNDWRMYHGQVIPGFPAHPHRGFETITVVLNGFVDHSDSHGAAGRSGHERARKLYRFSLAQNPASGSVWPINRIYRHGKRDP
jgi:hypothetical protein